MSQVYFLWRWLRLPLLIIALFMFGLTVWAAWVLTDQRYQDFLTEQLSERLRAEVQVRSSHITIRRGLGIELNEVTVREHATDSPFFTAEAIDIFLDVSALIRGQFDFRHILVTKPPLQVIAGVTQQAILGRLRQDNSRQQRSAQEAQGWFTPRFTLQQLDVEDGTLTYQQAASSSPLFFTSVDAIVVSTENGAVRAQVETSVGQQGEWGTLTLHTRSQGENTQVSFAQKQWQGELAFTDIRLQQIGQSLGKAWSQATLSFSGQYHGHWSGPVQLAGQLHASDAHIGAVRIDRGSLRLDTLIWPGLNNQQSMVVDAQFEDIHGVAGKTLLPLVVDKGTVQLANKTLTVTDLQGAVGTGSQLLDGDATISQLFGESPSALALQLKVRLDLAQDGQTALAMLPETNPDDALPQVTQPQGEAVAQLRINTDLGVKQNTKYEGEVTLNNVAFQLPRQNITVTDINGIVQITPAVLTISSLTGKFGTAPVTVQGQIRHYQSKQRAGELQLNFSEISAQAVAPLFPERVIVANNGALSGRAKIVLSSGNKLQTSGAIQLRGVQLDPLTFLRPFTVVVGEVNWQGDKGAFVVSKGKLADDAFTGHGRFSNVKPLQLDVSLDFPKLNVQQVIAVDSQRTLATSPKPTTVIKANITCGEGIYNNVKTAHLRLSLHWHDRQAEVDVANAKFAGGVVTGEVTVWPDLGALFFAPRVVGVDVQSFFRSLGKSSDVLTGTVTGGGKVYVEDWRRWANPAHWDAVWSLEVVDGVARRVPILVRLWSALSLQGVLQLQVPELPSAGLSFSRLTGELALGRGLAVTKKVSLNGDAVRIEASGQINLLADTADLLVQLMLLHGVTSALEWVPLVGDLLARGADLLTTVAFSVTGPYADPTVIPAFM